jgi:hypothetical protein
LKVIQGKRDIRSWAPSSSRPISSPQTEQDYAPNASTSCTWKSFPPAGNLYVKILTASGRWDEIRKESETARPSVWDKIRQDRGRDEIQKHGGEKGQPSQTNSEL